MLEDLPPLCVKIQNVCGALLLHFTYMLFCLWILDVQKYLIIKLWAMYNEFCITCEYCIWNTYNVLHSLICIFMSYSTPHATLTIFWIHRMHNGCTYVWTFKWHLARSYLCHIIFLLCLLNLKLNVNLLKPTDYVMHQQFNIQQLYVLPTLYLCVLYLSENKQRLVPLTA